MVVRGFALALLAFSAFAGAQNYPSRPLHLIVPYSVGSPPDIEGRIAASELQSKLGVPVVVANRPGAAGTIGLGELARAPADGYTLAAIAMPSAVAPALYPDEKLDLARDFAAVGQIVVSYNVLVVNPGVPATNVGQLVQLLKARPGSYSFGSGGNGTPAHLSGELFKQEVGFVAQHVPYNQLPQAVGDLVAGRIQFMFLASAPALAQVRAGGLRALAVTGPRRLEVLKDTPTMIEAGYPDFVIRDWVGLIVRRATSKAVIEHLNRALNRGLASPEAHAQMGRMGAEVKTGTPHAFDELIAAELERWGRLVKSARLKPD